jgi:hypothetical protein
VKLGPGSSCGLNIGTNKVLCILFEHLIDLVQQVVELGLELLALLGCRGDVLDGFLLRLGRGLLDLFSFSHVSS